MTTNATLKPDTTVACHGCQVNFPSRNAVFRHLRETNGTCLNAEDYQNFLLYVQSKEYIKILLLYGYVPSKECLVWDYSKDTPINDASHSSIRNGDDAARLMLRAVQETCGMKPDESATLNRSYGSTSRSTDITAQDDGTGAVSEVCMCKVPKTSFQSDKTEEWMAQVSERLSNSNIRILGCLEMPQKKFNAEMDVSRVRMEYILPADFLYMEDSAMSRQEFMESLPFFAGDSPYVESETHDKERPSLDTITYLFKLKKIMQSLTTSVVKLDPSDQAAVMEKSFHDTKKRNSRRRQFKDKKRQKRQDKKDAKQNKKPHEEEMTKKGKNVLRRRRFHNFTPRVMAHEYLAYRRLDRFHHVATLRHDDRPFLVLGLSGDLFLNGQACRVIGLFVALVRGVIDPDIVECIFDEEYPHLVPAPPSPSLGLYARDAAYGTWEGKCQKILNPRVSDRYPADRGWNSQATLQKVDAWRTSVQSEICKAWSQNDEAPTDAARLSAEEHWTEHVLNPWAETARQQLQQYRQWKKDQKGKHEGTKTTDAAEECAESDLATALTPTAISMVDATVPVAYEKVLKLLREANASGLWPSTTPKRQLVMVSSARDDVDPDSNDTSLGAASSKQPMSLSMARMIAKANTKPTDSSSAYSFAEGEGGASGSFSVGYMPSDGGSNDPKSNALFPELVKAAFELEVSLCPNREPSSTIAINRNAQFRPHVDSGAGAGQSISLIVGLGTYSGGELVVEGETKDIRYKPAEFNGWKQRHWTMPFSGERYSLVWFTPKGCEGKRGIDMNKDD